MAYTEHHLNYFELSPRQFEELCHWLLEAMGHREVRHWGDAGSEDGCDVVSTAPDGRRWVTQAKRVQRFGKAQAADEVRKVLRKPPTPSPDVYLLAATCPVSRETEEHLVEVIQGEFELKVWGLTSFDKRVREYPLVKARFFGPDEEPRTFWNVPPRNPFFTGREELLEELERRLAAAKRVASTQAITGLGGIGKTQTAVEFCYRHRADYPYVFWADASSADALRASYAQMAQRLKITTRETPVDEAAEMFQHWLSERGDWLLVLDNVDAPDEIRPLRPAASSGHLLVTSRDRKIQGFGQEPLGVGVLPSEQATDLLLRRARRDAGARSAAEELAEELGYLPLALEQAGAYVDIHEVSFADYLAAYRKRRLKLLDKEAPQFGDYPATVATTWNLSFKPLEKTAPVAAEVLRACAFYAPFDIPAEIFSQGGEYLGPAAAEVKEDLQCPLTFAELVLAPLQRYSLVTWDRIARTLSLHRLVQEVMLAQLETAGEWNGALECAHRALDAAMPAGRPDEPISWPQFQRLLPQVQATDKHWRKVDLDVFKVNPARILRKTGFYVFAIGHYKVARQLEVRALEVCRSVLGEEHQATLRSRNNLAATLRALGDYTGARDELSATLEVYGRLLGEEHPSTLHSRSNLAETLRSLGDYAAAQDEHAAVLEVRRRVLGEENQDTLRSRNNLAETLRSLGNYAGARCEHSATLAISRRTLGDEHPSTLHSRNNLAETLRSLEEYGKARDEHSAVLEVRRRVLGEEHPATLSSRNNLAETLRCLGDYVGARDHQLATLKISRRVLGREHPDSLRLIHNLSLTLEALGDTTRLTTFVEELLRCVAKLPERHEVRLAVLEKWSPEE